MSLVAAYGSSEESENSDSEPTENKENEITKRSLTTESSFTPKSEDDEAVENHVDNISDTEADSEILDGQQKDSKSVDTLLKGD